MAAMTTRKTAKKAIILTKKHLSRRNFCELIFFLGVIERISGETERIQLGPTAS